jgi:hypothetical protein
MQRRCDSCGKPYEAKRATSRFCGPNCRVRASRGVLAPPVVADEPLTVLPGGASPSSGLREATERRLVDAGCLDTWQGQAALDLARRIEGSAADTGSAYAALQRELRAAMAEALKGSATPQSAVSRHQDELARRRRRRGGE